MSPSTIPAAANAALASTIPQLHGHGHKRGLPVDAMTDPNSTSASQSSTGTTQDLFSTLLSSLEKAAGARLPHLGASSQTPAPTAPASPPAALATGSKLNVTA